MVIKEPSPEVTVKIEAKESHDSEAAADSLYCNKCDIKFNFPNTYVAHKQFYCKNGASSLDSEVLQAINKPSGQTVVTRAAETSVL